MREFMSYMTMRSIFLFSSTAFSLLVVMLFLNIITIDEVALILKLSPEAASALKVVVSRVQEVSGNMLDIISQLLNKLFSWAGVDVDLSKIKVDVNGNGGSPMHHNGVVAPAPGGSPVPAAPLSNGVPPAPQN